MGNIISSFFSGLSQAIGKLFASPLDFLTGKSCNSVCGSWDFPCYIENFCVANLLKMALVLLLSYIVILFFYLMHKLGIFCCIGLSVYRITWAIIASWFSFWECCFTFFCVKLCKPKRSVIMEEFVDSSQEYDSKPWEEGSIRRIYHNKKRRRRVHLRNSKSLRPRSHRVRVGFSTKHGHHHGSSVDDIRVTRTSKFAQKSANRRRRRAYCSRMQYY